MVSSFALLLLLASALVLYVGDGRGKDEPLQSPAPPPPPEPAPAADVFVLRPPVREPVIPGGGYSGNSEALDLTEWASGEVAESEESGQADGSLDVIASRMFGANAMHAVSSDPQDGSGFPRQTPGMFAGMNSAAGSMFGGSRVSNPDDPFETASEIVNFEPRNDPELNASPSLLSEISDRTGELPLLPVLEDLSTGRLLPLVETPIVGLPGPTDVTFDPQDPLDPQGSDEPSTPVPEPGTLLLMSGALGSFVARRRLQS
jgi:hypothetical protein